MLLSDNFPDLHGATALAALGAPRRPKKRGAPKAPRGPRIPAGNLKAALDAASKRKRPRDLYHDGDQGDVGSV